MPKVTKGVNGAAITPELIRGLIAEFKSVFGLDPRLIVLSLNQRMQFESQGVLISATITDKAGCDSAEFREPRCTICGVAMEVFNFLLPDELMLHAIKVSDHEIIGEYRMDVSGLAVATYA